MEKVLVGDCIDKLKELGSESVNCIVTSPPYYGLRDYGTGEWVGGDPNCPHRRTSKYSDKTITGHAQEELKGNVVDAIYKTVCPLCGAVRVDKQIGLEETPEEYIDCLVNVFHECKRVLKDDGTLWLNIGDSFAGASNGGTKRQGNDVFNKNRPSRDLTLLPPKQIPNNCKAKDLIGIPWMLAFALRNDGWYLRQDIIWHKPNPMPESVKDRCVKSHEYIFLLSKKPHYYFDYEAIQEDAVCKDDSRGGCGRIEYDGKRSDGGVSETLAQKSFVSIKEKRNKRDVWRVTTQAVKEAHFATFPEKLIEPCILAGCPVDGTVLDPFCGSGTTGIVSVRNQRNFIGIELNPEYASMSERRIKKEKRQGIQVTFNMIGGDNYV